MDFKKNQIIDKIVGEHTTDINKDPILAITAVKIDTSRTVTPYLNPLSNSQFFHFRFPSLLISFFNPSDKLEPTLELDLSQNPTPKIHRPSAPHLPLRGHHCALLGRLLRPAQQRHRRPQDLRRTLGL
jgi:hypothetical protein